MRSDSEIIMCGFYDESPGFVQDVKVINPELSMVQSFGQAVLFNFI